jgi:hypothetical protein
MWPSLVPVRAQSRKVLYVAWGKLTTFPGWYGLSAAKTYLRLRPDLRIQIIDNDTSVGGVWSRDRLYPNLVAQVKLGVSASKRAGSETH